LTLPFSGDTEHEAGTALQGPTHAHGAYLFPTSFAQERLWSLDQSEPGRHNILSALRLQGRLSIAALLQSIAALVRRHETLRTSFVTVNGTLSQSIALDLAIALPLVDLRRLGKDQQAALVQQMEQHEARYPFDLAHGPLMRTTLLWLDVEEPLLLLTLHQSIADAWSANVWINELNILYASFTAGGPSPLPELPIQYADYAAWQREWLHGEVLEQELAYWKKQLAGAPAVLELPTDYPRPAVQTHSGAPYHFILPAALTKELESLSRKKGVTLFMALLAAFQTLLARLTDRQDIVVGTPVAGRTPIEVAQGRFHVEWRYCTRLHRLETIEVLARRYLGSLEALIEHCRAPEAGGYTPSDFSGSGLNQAKLDKIMAKIRSNKQA
jgi:hypothetical protein